VGNRPVLACRRLLKPGGAYVAVSGPKGRLLGPFPRMAWSMLVSLAGRRKMTSMMAQMKRRDLAALGDLIERREVTPVVDRNYPLRDAADALRYQGEGHAQGKIVVSIVEE
jgi:NADPH:quinone reductase-like Zn-dependent oxidoreductase